MHFSACIWMNKCIRGSITTILKLHVYVNFHIMLLFRVYSYNKVSISFKHLFPTFLTSFRPVCFEALSSQLNGLTLHCVAYCISSILYFLEKIV